MEKRAHVREKLAFPVEIKTPTNSYQVVMMDVTTDGLGILSNKVIPTGPCKVRLENKMVEGRIVYGLSGGRGQLDPDQALFQCGIRLKESLSEQFIRILFAKSRLRGSARS